MNFDIDAKAFRDVLRLTGVCKTASSKPLIPSVFLSLDDEKLYLKGMEMSGSVQSAITVSKDNIHIYEKSENDVPIDIPRILKILSSIKGNVNVSINENEIVIKGEKIKHSENLPSDAQDTQVPIIFKSLGEKSTFSGVSETLLNGNIVPFPDLSEDLKFKVLMKIDSFPKVPVETDKVNLNIKKDSVYLSISDEISKTDYELSKSVKWVDNDIEKLSLILSSNIFTSVADIIKNNMVIYANEACVYCLGVKSWGFVGYIIPVWDDV